MLPTFVFDVTKTFSRATFFKDSLIKLTVKHINLYFWLSSHKITSIHYEIYQICQRGKLPQKRILIKCLQYAVPYCVKPKKLFNSE